MSTEELKRNIEAQRRENERLKEVEEHRKRDEREKKEAEYKKRVERRERMNTVILALTLLTTIATIILGYLKA
jgi:hypothetical protein